MIQPRPGLNHLKKCFSLFSDDYISYNTPEYHKQLSFCIIQINGLTLNSVLSNKMGSCSSFYTIHISFSNILYCSGYTLILQDVCHCHYWYYFVANYFSLKCIIRHTFRQEVLHNNISYAIFPFNSQMSCFLEWPASILENNFNFMNVIENV